MPRPDDLHALPGDLPIPVGDGACDHLRGAKIPAVALASTSGRTVDLARQSATSRIVVYCYPKTGLPELPSPPGWDAIPGARGCTPQTCGFRDHHAEFAALGARVYGLSTQSTTYQAEMAARLHLPFEVLSDERRAFSLALRLPTFGIGGETFLRRVTLVLRGGRIEHVFYPVFPPDRDAEGVLEWLRASPSRPPIF